MSIVSGACSSRAAQAVGTSATARSTVRSARGSPNRSSSTWCTTVPRTAAGLGASGRRSSTRNRYSSGQVMKSDARDGDRDVRGPAGTAGSGADAPGCSSGTDRGTALMRRA